MSNVSNLLQLRYQQVDTSFLLQFLKTYFIVFAQFQTGLLCSIYKFFINRLIFIKITISRKKIAKIGKKESHPKKLDCQFKIYVSMQIKDEQKEKRKTKFNNLKANPGSSQKFSLIDFFSLKGRLMDKTLFLCLGSDIAVLHYTDTDPPNIL